ncbi:hypothetical protein ACUY2R_03705 [Corynebacterium mastitidis]
MKISRTSIAAALASAAIATSALSAGASSAPAGHPRQETPQPSVSQAEGSPAGDVLHFLEHLIPITSRVVKIF